MIPALLAASPSAGPELLRELAQRRDGGARLQLALARNPNTPDPLAGIVVPWLSWAQRPREALASMGSVLERTTNRSTVARILDDARLSAGDLLWLAMDLPAGAFARTQVHARLSHADLRNDALKPETRTRLLTDPATPALARERYLRAAIKYERATPHVTFAYALALLTPGLRERVMRRHERELDFPSVYLELARRRGGDLAESVVRRALADWHYDAASVLSCTGHDLAAHAVLDDPDASGPALGAVVGHRLVSDELRLAALLRSDIRGSQLLNHPGADLLVRSPVDFLNAHLVDLVGRDLLGGHPCLGRLDLDAGVVREVWRMALDPSLRRSSTGTTPSMPREFIATWVATHPATGTRLRRQAAEACCEHAQRSPHLAALAAAGAQWAARGPRDFGANVPVHSLTSDSVWFSPALTAAAAWLSEADALHEGGTRRARTLLALAEAGFRGTLRELVETATTIAA